MKNYIKLGLLHTQFVDEEKIEFDEILQYKRKQEGEKIVT